MEYDAFFEMVNQDLKTTQCTVHDKTPGSEQRRINIVVRSHYTVSKVINDITTQYRYDNFDLVLQPLTGDLVYLNDLREQLLFEVAGFDATIKNILILLPSGEWDGNVKKRYDLTLQPLKCITNSSTLLAQAQTTAAVAVTLTATTGPATIATSVAGVAPMKQRKHAVTAFETFTTSTTITSTTTTSNINNNNHSNKAARSSIAGGSAATSTLTSSYLQQQGQTVPHQHVYQHTTTTTTTTTVANNNNHNQINNNNINNNNNNNNAMSMCIDTTMTTATTGTVAASSMGDGLMVTPSNGLGHGIIGGVLMLGGGSSINRPSSPSTATNISATDSLNLSPMSEHEQLSDDDLALGASASPTEPEPMNGSSANGSVNILALAQTSPTGSRDDDSTIKSYYDRQYPMVTMPTKSNGAGGGKGYVGLVNQAMTCYLNSLLQALFMTPEFRNGLYNWEFDNDNDSKSIPYQLQKLFLNLQTSHKSAVETTDLTRSFGWDSSEAWQQHDIQELCRVMFDALEHKFKNTKQADLISSLYEGKMIDYVKCLECNTEKSREDTFLDIPLPVRPFGNKEAYGSIEEALRAFIQPETLDGNNQYHCEKCNKKCDAHKGLKFKCFPYVLTLHLKRFDFNYQTMHRIKINDKVTFPEMLNLNSFVESESGESGACPNGTTTHGGPTDDCSTTDSGSAMEEDTCSIGIATNGGVGGQHEQDMNDEDEGIDLSTSTDHRISGSNGNSITADFLKQEKGPYLYELFAIMIHSGSASGGHYFAYIKEFENNEWFCFNDQSVTPITQEDIEKSYGGGSSRPYYTSVYSSSINAYMLMYRQVDPKRNERSMKVDDFPAHINTLLSKLRTEDETRVTRASRHTTYADLGLPDIVKPRVYFYNPVLKKLKMSRIHVTQSFDINTVLEIAYQNLDVEQFAPLSRCRLVGYDQSTEAIVQSFENVSDVALTEIRASYDGTLDFLLECHDEGQEFEVYEPGGATWRVFMVNMVTMEMDGPFLVYSPSAELTNALRHSIAVRLHVKETELIIATLPNFKAFVAYDPLPTKESQDYLQDLAETHFRHLTFFYLNVPNTDHATLEITGIPAYDSQTSSTDASLDVVDAVLMNGSNVTGVHRSSNLDESYDNLSSNCGRACNDSGGGGLSPVPGLGNNTPSSPGATNLTTTLPPPASPQSAKSTAATATSSAGQESNSEDSSLSDGDRTLVESVKNRGAGSQVSSTAHSPQLSSPEDESTAEDRFRSFYAILENDATFNHQNSNTRALFFHAIKTGALDINTLSSSYYSSTDDDVGRKPTRAYKLIVDSHMKVHEFKKHIEALLRVPCNYFKIMRKQQDTFMQPKQNHSLFFLNEGETMTVELGKLLQFDEFKAKIFYLRLSDMNNDVGKLTNVCEWVHNSTITAGMAKRELIAKLKRIDEKYQTLSMENCRLWLKSGRTLFKIYSDDDESLAADFRVAAGVEFVVQECEDGVSPRVPPDSITLFVRQWHPETYELGKFQEITLEKDGEIMQALSKLSGIPEKNIEYSRVNSPFPCTNISLLSINSLMNWYSIPATADKYPMTAATTGNFYFYKDSTKESKELTTEERRSINIKEKIRLDRLGCATTSRYSPRRERALKIYLDSPQTTNTSTAATANKSAAVTPQNE